MSLPGAMMVGDADNLLKDDLSTESQIINRGMISD